VGAVAITGDQRIGAKRGDRRQALFQLTASQRRRLKESGRDDLYLIARLR
jgi:hypothetical protein